MSGRKILITCSCFVLCIVLCFISYVSHVTKEKKLFATQLSRNIDQYFLQQKYSLQRLGNSLLPALREQNTNIITATLNTYEEILFGLAQQDLAIPVSISWVSLSAPQQILGSFGAVATTALSPDTEYYIRAVEEPDTLAVSHLYIKSEMPDYPLFNYGLGIKDNSNNYYGQLDVKIAAVAFKEYITAKLNNDADLFGFELHNGNVSEPEIHLNQAQCWLGCLKYIVIRVAMLITFIASFFMMRKLVQRFIDQKNTLVLQSIELKNNTHTLQIISQGQSVQRKYGELLQIGLNNKQNISLQQLLTDIHAVNAPFALENNLQLELQSAKVTDILFYGNKLRVMQILSGITYEVLQQLGANGKLNLQINLIEQSHVKQTLEFIFTDNGFYKTLQEREVMLSVTDIRCQGWQNISALIALEDGVLEHTHTAYSGNTIRLKITRELVNNVVKLEEYCL